MKVSAGKRVLMLVENLPYPQDVRVRQEAAALVAAGYQVSVICPAGSHQLWHEVLAGVHVYRYPAPPASDGLLGYFWEYSYSLAATFVLSLLLGWRPGFDIIHAANPPDTAVFIAAFYKLMGKRFVFDHHDLAPEVYAARFGRRSSCLIYQTLILLEKLTCRVADHVIATNESYAAIERQRGKVPAGRITVVRNGPPLESLQPVEPELDLRRRASTILGYAGRMGPQDGVDYLLRALHQLIGELGKTDFLCVLVGAGDAVPALKALSAQLCLTDHVLFTGWVTPTEVARYLSAADICVTPDPSNPYSDRSTMIKIMEYMALGKPVVAFDLPEHRVTAQDAAVYARPNDELDFARQIAWLMDDPERRRKMGLVGRQRVETELAWSHQQENLLAAYRALRNGVVEGASAGLT